MFRKKDKQLQEKEPVSDDKVVSESHMAPMANQINWNEFNYPPLLKLFRFKRAQIPETLKWQVFLQWLNHIMIIIGVTLNLITNIISTATGYQGGLRIGISACLMVLWIPASLYAFYLPYMIVMKNEGSRFIFYLGSAGIVIFFIMWGIADFADCNGFVRMSNLFSDNKTAAAVFALFTSITDMVIGILGIVNAVWVYKRK